MKRLSLLSKIYLSLYIVKNIKGIKDMGFAIGFIAGGLLGVIIMCCLAISKDVNEQEGDFYGDKN